MIRFELPFPPSINHYYRHVANRTLISREGRAYRQRICSIIAGMGLRPLTGKIVMHIDVYPPDLRRRDIDNIQKALLDALEHAGAYDNDNQITKLVTERMHPEPNGLVIVSMWSA